MVGIVVIIVLIVQLISFCLPSFSNSASAELPQSVINKLDNILDGNLLHVRSVRSTLPTGRYSYSMVSK